MRGTAASLLRRLAAFAVDYAVLSVYLAALTLVAVGLGTGPGSLPTRAFSDPLRAQLVGMAVLTLPVVLYFTVGEASSWRATPGKRVLGLRVVDVDGGRLPWTRALLRTALKFVPWEVAHTCLWRIPGWPAEVEAVPVGVIAGLVAVWLLVGWYVAAALRSDARRTPYDRAAAARVVRV